MRTILAVTAAVALLAVAEAFALAEQDDIDKQVLWMAILEITTDVTRDIDAAGNPVAAGSLALENVLPKDEVSMLQLNAAQGNVKAQYNLGWMYEQGKTVPKNYAAAAKWYTKAAEQGDAGAQLNLGWMYMSGEGRLKDYAKAVEWLRKAADQGNATAELDLGFAYYGGPGVARDYKESMKWMIEAAEQGLAVAEWHLGWAYSKGRGVPKDLVKAYVWEALAADQGIVKAKDSRDHFAEEMSIVQTVEAEQLLQKKRATDPPNVEVFRYLHWERFTAHNEDH